MSSPSTTLGKYQIIREIARSNDIVYEAYDPLMNRRVALKELAVPNGSTPQQKEERLRRFLREAKAAGSLAHPNIVTIYEVGEDAGRHYLVMEYLDGHTLRNELDAKGFLPKDDAVNIAESVLRGLEYAHQNGVIHRDIKPENIQLLSDGRVKLTDFGIARLTFEPNLTMDGQVFGTPSYMSPEQVVGKDIDVRSDLFSVGVVLYEMLAGQKPFLGDSVVTITYAITNKDPARVPQIPDSMWQVISKAMDKSPQMRYSNAPEMLSAIDFAKRSNVTVLPGDPVQAVPPIANPYLPPPPGNPFLTPYPGGSYQGAPAPPPQYPYNPYGGTPAPPNPNPYAPIQQTYLPGQYAPTQQTYLPGGSYGPVLPNPPSVPVYYPPPHKPLLKPEQRELVSKIILVVLALGVAFALLFVVLMSLSSNSNPIPPTPVYPNNSALIPDSSTPDPSATQQANREFQQALRYTQKAAQDDPQQSIEDLNRAISNFEQSANDYSKGGWPDKAQSSFDQAAGQRLELAQLLESTDREAARQTLFSARKEVTRNSHIAYAINKEIWNLS